MLKRINLIAVLIIVILLLAFLPNFVSRYYLSLFINLYMYLILAVCWSFFSGTTGYISLSTAAFFGIGVYLMAILGKSLPIPLVFLIALLSGFLIASFIGLSTLRLRGIYFVIFSFGLSELLRQLFKWYEVNVTGTVGRHVALVSYGSTDVYYYLMVFSIIIVLLNWYFQKHHRLGYALRSIGQNEEAAASSGVNTTFYKVFAFALSSSLMTLVGATITLRWSYIDPYIAFNPNISFLVVVMALLGGVGVHYGPILGVIPLVLLSEFLSTTYPHHFMMLLGFVYIIVIYIFEDGVIGFKDMLINKYFQKINRKGAVSNAQD